MMPDRLQPKSDRFVKSCKSGWNGIQYVNFKPTFLENA